MLTILKVAALALKLQNATDAESACDHGALDSAARWDCHREISEGSDPPTVGTVALCYQFAVDVSKRRNVAKNTYAAANTLACVRIFATESRKPDYMFEIYDTFGQ